MVCPRLRPQIAPARKKRNKPLQNKGLWEIVRQPAKQGQSPKLRGQDSNLRPRGYEPRELPGCSTPRHLSFYSSPAAAVAKGAFAGWLLQGGMRLMTPMMLNGHANEAFLPWV